MLADPPNLSRLALRDGAPIDATLLERLAAQQGGRKPDCDRHQYPVADMKSNCAKDGYLMVKEAIAYPPNPEVATVTGALGKDYLLTDAFGKPCKVRALRRGVPQRKQLFETEHEQYLHNEQNFKRRCAQFFNPTKDAAGNKIVETFGLEYHNNINDIARYTDFYYIDHDAPDPRPDDAHIQYLAAVEASQKADNPKSKGMLHMSTDRGFIFLSVMDTPERKRKFNMPAQGVYAEPYVYVLVVCAAGFSGYGSVLLNLGEQLAAQVGLRRMALAALPNACGAYYARGYRFAPWSGNVINLPDKFFKDDKKTGKRTLLWEEDVDSELERDMQPEREEFEREAQASRVRTRSQWQKEESKTHAHADESVGPPAWMVSR